METLNRPSRKPLSLDSLSDTTYESETFKKIQNNRLATEGGKSAVVLYFKTTTKHRSNYEPKLLLNNYVTDGGLKVRGEKFKDSRDFVKKSDRISTTTGFKFKTSNRRDLNIKISDEDNFKRNQTDYFSERKRRTDYCQTNIYSSLHNNQQYQYQQYENVLTSPNHAKHYEKVAHRKRKEYVVPSVTTKIRQRLIDKDDNNDEEGDYHKEQAQTEIISEKKKKKIEELMKRNQENAFHELEIHLVNETTHRKYHDIEKKINLLKQNDVSIQSIIDQVEGIDQDEQLEVQEQAEGAENPQDEEEEEHKDNQYEPEALPDDDNPQVLHTEQLEVEIEHKESEVVTEYNQQKTSSKSQRDVELKKMVFKPRVNVYEYLNEIAKCMGTHRKSNSSLPNRFIREERKVSNADIKISQHKHNDGNNTEHHQNSFRKKSCHSGHSKSISHSKASSKMYDPIKVEEKKSYNLEESESSLYFKTRKRQLMNSEDFDQMIMEKVIKEKEKINDNDQSLKEKNIKKFIKLLQLQEMINKRRAGQSQKNSRMIRNEYYVGKKSIKNNNIKHSLSQSTIIEQNDFYTNIIQTKGILGEKLRSSQNTSLHSISKGDYDQFLQEKELKMKKGEIRTTDADHEKKMKLINMLKKKQEREKTKELIDFPFKDKETTNEPESEEKSSSRPLSQELLAKVQRTLNKANYLHTNENLNKLLEGIGKESSSRLSSHENNTERREPTEESNEKTNTITRNNNNVHIETNSNDPSLPIIISTEENDLVKDEIPLISIVEDKQENIETPRKDYKSTDKGKKSSDKKDKSSIDHEQSNKSIHDSIHSDNAKEEAAIVSNNNDNKNKLTDLAFNEEIIISRDNKHFPQPIMTNNESVEEKLIQSMSSSKDQNDALVHIEYEEVEIDENDEELKETQLKIFEELFKNFGDWYVFFIKRNIMINIVKYANIRSSYQSGFEIITEIVKREPFYQLNRYYKYQLYLSILRGCFSHYVRKAFNQIANYSFYTRRVEVFVEKMDILIKFITLEHIHYFGEAKYQLAHGGFDDYEEYEEDEEEEYMKNSLEVKLRNKYTHQANINEVIAELEHSNTSDNKTFDLVNLFVQTIHNVFIMPVKCHALQQIFDYALRDEEIEYEEDEEEQDKSQDLCHKRSKNDISLENYSNCSDKKDKDKTIKKLRHESEDSDLSHHKNDLFKDKPKIIRNIRDNDDKSSNDSYYNDQTQKSIRHNEISLLNSSQMSQYAYSVQSNKSFLGIGDLKKMKPGLKFKLHLDEIKTPLKNNELIGKTLFTPTTNTIQQLVDQIPSTSHQRRLEKCNTTSENDISADKDMISGIDWEDPVNLTKNNNTNSLIPSPMIKEENSEGPSFKGNKSEDIIDLRVSTNSQDEEVKKPIKSNDDDSDEEKYSNEFNEIENIDEVHDSNLVDSLIEEKKREEMMGQKSSNQDDKLNQQTSIDSADNNNMIEIIEPSPRVENEIYIQQSTTGTGPKNLKAQKVSKVNNRYDEEDSEDSRLNLLKDIDKLQIQAEQETISVEKFMEECLSEKKGIASEEDIEEFTNDIMNAIIKSEITYSERALIPKKKPLSKIDPRVSHSDSIGPGNSFRSAETINTNSVFMRSVGEIKKEVTLNLYTNNIAPLVYNLISNEIQANYQTILNKISLPLTINAEMLMNGFLLRDEKLKEGSKNAISPQDQCFISKSLLKSFDDVNKQVRNEDNVTSDHYYDNILNDCLIDATNEIIERDRKYGEIGVPLPWSIRSREVTFKYDPSPESCDKMKDMVISSLKTLMSTRMGLIGINHEYLDSEQLSQDREKKFIKSIRQELLEEETVWKALEREETDVKLLLSRVIMEQLLNEVVEILEHVQLSRREPLKYQHKSIYACEDIPRLSFQNTTENDNHTNENEEIAYMSEL